MFGLRVEGLEPYLGLGLRNIFSVQLAGVGEGGVLRAQGVVGYRWVFLFFFITIKLGVE